MQEFKQRRCDLGESPVWHEARGQYFWVDIIKGHIHALSQDKTQVDTIVLPDKVGCIVVLPNGNLMAALARSIVEVDIDCHEIKTLCEPHLDEFEMFNDGKCDAQGRFWVATKDTHELNPLANLYCFDETGLHLKQKGVTIGNGIGWSRDNHTMYFTDSPKQTIYQYDFDVKRGHISNRRIFAKITNGYPDGLCVDDDSNVWSAHWDGGALTCYAPNGEILKEQAMPCQRPTSCCLGGANGQEMFVTSASIGLAADSNPEGHCYLFHL